MSYESFWKYLSSSSTVDLQNQKLMTKAPQTLFLTEDGWDFGIFVSACVA